MIIDQLPLLGGDVQGTDEFPIERGTTTYKTTQAALIKPATDAAAAAQAAADDAQLAADNAQDTADEANEKGLPPGGTAGQVLTKADSSDYSASWEDPSGGDALYFTGVAISATTGDIASISNAKITADHVVAECIFASPSAITTDITWTTSAGSLVLNGTCSAATTADIVLVKKSN